MTYKTIYKLQQQVVNLFNLKVTVFKKRNTNLKVHSSFDSGIMFVTKTVLISEEITEYMFRDLLENSDKFSTKLNIFIGFCRASLTFSKILWPFDFLSRDFQGGFALNVIVSTTNIHLFKRRGSCFCKWKNKQGQKFLIVKWKRAAVAKMFNEWSSAGFFFI